MDLDDDALARRMPAGRKSTRYQSAGAKTKGIDVGGWAWAHFAAGRPGKPGVPGMPGVPGVRTVDTRMTQEEFLKVLRQHMQRALLRARAHLASCLDEYLGYGGYVLRQEVTGCTTHAQLEALYGTARARLACVMGETGAAGVIDRVRLLLLAPPAP
jgi:hypothetical protein